jgi:hypothetical protein
LKLVRIGNRFLARGEVGDRIPDALVRLAREQSWMSGSLTGIGGVKDLQLAYFDLERREYLPIRVAGIVELVSLTGNLALVNGNPFWHLHAAVSDRNGHVFAGHLTSLEVAITVECWLDVSTTPVSRARDPETGLNLLDI